jgi:hypothetical protein
MAANPPVEEEISVHRQGPEVLLALSAPAARRLADEIAERGGEHGEWLDEVARLLTAGAAEQDAAERSATEDSHGVLLRGNWATGDELELPLPFTKHRPLETIGPGLVGAWRTRISSKHDDTPAVPVPVSHPDLSEAQASLAAQVSAAAKLLDDTRGHEQTEQVISALLSRPR